MITYLLLGLGLAVGAYQLLAAGATLLFLRRRDPDCTSPPPGVSILKPLRGLDEEFYSAIRSHATQEYSGEYEILFGVQDPHDPAVPLVERLQREFPDRRIRLIVSTQTAPNGKVGVLLGLAPEARYPILLVNDSDITVPADYLRRVVAPLRDSAIGLVTCLYRATAGTWAARWEALSIATDFAPGVLVAPLVGVREFALGSTLCFRAADLQRIGGFGAVAEYIADDYQLGKQISELGLRNHLSRVVVETRVGGRTWSEVWAHQVRWARTIRVSKGGGYLGIPLTLAGLWALLLAAAGFWVWAGLLVAIRLLSAWLTCGIALQDRQSTRLLLFVPLRDCLAFILWLTGLQRGEVIWRDKTLRLTPDGRIRLPLDSSRPNSLH